MDTKKLVKLVVGASVAIVAVLLAWRADPVQQVLRPEKFWLNKSLIMEIEVESLRNRVIECTAAAQKISINADTAKMPAEPGSRAETVAKLCSSYDEDLKAAVESLIAVKKKLKEAKG